MMLCHVHVRQIALLVLFILGKQEAEHGVRVVGRDYHRKLALVNVEDIRPLEVQALERGVVIVRLQELLVIGRALALRICIIEVDHIEEEFAVSHWQDPHDPLRGAVEVIDWIVSDWNASLDYDLEFWVIGMQEGQFVIERLCCETEEAWPTAMIRKMDLLHLQDDLVLEPVQVSQLNIALRVEEYVVFHIVNVAACHVLWELPLQRFSFIIVVADGLNRSVLGMFIDLDHVNYLGLGPLAYYHASHPVLGNRKTQQALCTMSKKWTLTITLRYRDVLQEFSVLDAEDENVTICANEDFLLILREDDLLRLLKLWGMQGRKVLAFGDLFWEKVFYVRGIVDVNGIQLHVSCNYEISTWSRELELFHVLLYKVNRHG
jgi:hypothetical protein